MMKAIITIQHPAHVHFFRNAIKELRQEGHEIHVFARKKDITLDLLEQYNIDYSVIAGDHNGLLSLAHTQLKYELGILRKAVKIKPDVLTAISEPSITHTSKLVGGKSVLFVDTEHATLQNTLAFPFADKICTPDCYIDDIGSNQINYPGYHELAYLHPNRFTPNPNILDEVGVSNHDKLVVLRLVSWDAAHDIGNQGFEDTISAVRELESTGATVLITSEKKLPNELEENRVSVPIHQIHDLIYYSDLFIGEGSTMASESAVLGTPAIFVSSLELGYTNELESKYGLVFNYTEDSRQQKALDRAISLLEDDNDWGDRRAQLLQDKIDTTKFIVDQLKEVSR